MMISVYGGFMTALDTPATFRGVERREIKYEDILTMFNNVPEVDLSNVKWVFNPNVPALILPAIWNARHAPVDGQRFLDWAYASERRFNLLSDLAYAVDNANYREQKRLRKIIMQTWQRYLENTDERITDTKQAD